MQHKTHHNTSGSNCVQVKSSVSFMGLQEKNHKTPLVSAAEGAKGEGFWFCQFFPSSLTKNSQLKILLKRESKLKCVEKAS